MFAKNIYDVIRILVFTLLAIVASSELYHFQSFVWLLVCKASIDTKQLRCMAINIFYEANGESVARRLFALVVLNRVAHGFATSICGVVNQFKIINDIKICRQLGVRV